MEQMQRMTLGVQRERVLLAGCLLPGAAHDMQDPLNELRALADTAGAVVVDELLQKREKPDPGSYIGKGKVDELRDMAAAHGAQTVIFLNELTPSQIANLEQAIEVKVLDRSELILDIFAARARTHEAKLQVELAQLEYTYPRLRAMWSHLERITGGSPTGIGTRGPGEQQLEIDRRIVQRKKADLKRRLAEVEGQKQRQVATRNKDFFTVGLVGYTNAGKSTLFNALTDGGAYQDDKLFATLSTRTRDWTLGQGDHVMLSDTVGFVRDLPHHLVASFKATLEEAVHADLLLVVVDIADHQAAEQARTVMEVLDDIGATDPPRLVVLNKVDAIKHNADLLVLERQYPEAVQLSARSGEGLDTLIERVRDAARGQMQQLTLSLDAGEGKAIHFLENRATVLDRHYENNRVTMQVRIGRRQLDQLKSIGQSLRLPTNDAAGAEGEGDGEDLSPTESGWGRR
jgi:GTP-binding protein HflX